eukprot:TCALIF_05020-PA protein Name:"Protein of unknown function" AED:0.03 eAED:0.03 QI:0/1/0/1/0/0.5/2/0/90
MISVSSTQERSEERVIGYGMTNLGRTVLTGGLVVVLGAVGVGAVVLAGRGTQGARGVTTQRRGQNLGPHWQKDRLCQLRPLLPQCLAKLK